MPIRTTITMDEDLLTQVRELAASRGWSLGRTVAELVRLGLHSRPPPDKRVPLQWHTFRGDAPPTVDIADRDQLYEVMEGQS